MGSIWLVMECECIACDPDIRLETDEGIDRIVEAYTQKEYAVAAISEWASTTGAVPYPGGPEHGVRVSDGEMATYRCLSEVKLVK